MRIIHLSTVTPVYRGADTLRELVAELGKLRESLETGGGPLRLTEAIFVDDGSSDGSDQVLDELRNAHDWVQVVELSRNFGQHPATMAGVLHASGDWVATLDEDLQHHPQYLLPLLRQAVMDKQDVVYAHPEFAVHQSVFRDWSSRGYKWLIARLSGNPHVRKFNSFRMMRASIARAAAAVAAHQTYFDLAVCWFTTRVGTTVLPLKDMRYIKEGRSGYSFRSLLTHARRMLESSEVKALRVGAMLGVVAMAMAAVVAILTVVLKLVAPQVITAQGWASVMVAVLFFGGLNALLAGLVLEHLSIVLMQSHGKPTFFEVDRRDDEHLRDWFARQEAAE